LPPLRARTEEIPLLLDHFMNRNAEQYGRSPRMFSPILLQACLAYDWPGNLRELENFVRRFFVMGDETIAISELQSKRKNVREPETQVAAVHYGAAKAFPGNGVRPSFKSFVQNAKNGAEIQAIMHALEKTSWNRRRAAKTLNISYRALLYKIQQHGLKPFNVLGSNSENGDQVQ